MRARPAARPSLPARSRRTASLLAVLSTLLLAGVVAPAPAAAATRDVRITQDGPVPARLTVEAGDSVRFVNTDSFIHRVVSDSNGWAFDTGTLVPGESFTVKPALTRAGTYDYRGAGLDRFVGSVVVPATASTPRPAASSPAPRPQPSSAAPVVPVPAPSRSAEPAAPASSAPSAAPSGSAAPAPASTGGTGVVQGPPPLAGGSFGGFGSPSTPVPGGPAPLVAPGEPLPDGSGAAPEVAGAPVAPEVAGEPGGTTVALGGLPVLGSPVEARRYGLPLVLATVLLAGVVSLLVRLLLAEAPAGGRGPATA